MRGTKDAVFFEATPESIPSCLNLFVTDMKKVNSAGDTEVAALLRQKHL